jgi:hypothetical protein
MIALGFLFGLLPRWVWLGLAALLIATLCAWSWSAGARHAEAKHAAAALAASEAAAAETERRITTIEEARRAAELRTHQALADAAAAAGAAERLRKQLAAYVSAARSDPAAASRREAAGDPIGVLADVFSRCDAQQGVMAKHADAAREAGRLCEQSYDALRRID